MSLRLVQSRPLSKAAARRRVARRKSGGTRGPTRRKYHEFIGTLASRFASRRLLNGGSMALTQKQTEGWIRRRRERKRLKLERTGDSPQTSRNLRARRRGRTSKTRLNRPAPACLPTAVGSKAEPAGVEVGDASRGPRCAPRAQPRSARRPRPPSTAGPATRPTRATCRRARRPAPSLTTSSIAILSPPAIAGASLSSTREKSDEHEHRGGRNYVRVDAMPSDPLVHQP
jgi:hypothetical protein